MTRPSMMVIAAALGVAFAGPAAAQDEGHTIAPQSGQLAPECLSGAQAALAAFDALGARLEAARQTNAPAAMRQALEDVQARVSSLRLHLAPCMPTASTKPGAAPTPHGAPESQAAPMSGMGHSTMPGMSGGAVNPPAAAQAEAVDPVCGMKVADPKAAPSASHNGQTYYFCSLGDRSKFLGNPDAYARPKP